jgi:glucosamine-phosphate N-acetyltransferase
VPLNGKQINLEVCHGTIIINHRKAINGDPVGIIEDVWTHEDYRQKGYGRKLVQELVDFAKTKKCYKVVLDCNDHNVAFYSKIGFKKWQNSMRIDI